MSELTLDYVLLQIFTGVCWGVVIGVGVLAVALCLTLLIMFIVPLVKFFWWSVKILLGVVVIAVLVVAIPIAYFIRRVLEVGRFLGGFRCQKVD